MQISSKKYLALSSSKYILNFGISIELSNGITKSIPTSFDTPAIKAMV